MGLGKTLQLITLLHTLNKHTETKINRILIICPKSTIMNWNDEFEKWQRDIPGDKLNVFLCINTKPGGRVKVN